jgi:23S rRNA pseudouridine1911/1915/1917 synthase
MNRPAIPVLYEDNHLLVIDKPAGLLSQEDSSGHPDVLTVLKDYVKEKYNKPGNVFLGLVHRLDRNTTGLMVVARTSKAASRLSEQFRKHTVEKLYQAVVSPPPAEKEDRLEDRMEKDEENRMAKAAWGSAGEKAILEYVVVRQTADRALLEVRLFTGRFHQIRFQLSHAGFPVVGDKKYGSNVPGKLALRCVRLSFNHPTTKERLVFDAGSNWADAFL